MAEKIIVLDFTGALIKANVVEEANELRANILRRALPTKNEHANPEMLYKKNREFLKKLTDISENFILKYRKNDYEMMELSAKDALNQMSTNLFQIGMYMVAKKYGLDMMPKGLLKELRRLKDLGYRLAIFTGVRTDIVSGMLQIAEVPLDFDYINGQPPILEADENEDMLNLAKNGEIVYIIGDKMSDLERSKYVDAKTVFVKWGHPFGGEEKFADYTIENPEELSKIIQS